MSFRISLKSFLFIFLALAPFSFANIENEKWIFHTKKGDLSFPLVEEVRGTPFVALPQLEKLFKLQIKTQSASEIEIRGPHPKRWAKISTSSSLIRASWGNSHALSRPPVKKGKEWRVPIDFGDRVLKPLIDGQVPPLPQNTRPLLEAQVLIDPGHGGNDYGAQFGKLREKDLTLILAQDLSRELEKLSIPTSLTRHQDVFLSLQERTQMAHRSQAKIFISIHLNSEPKAKSSGFEVYILSLDETKAETIQAVASENQIIPRELPEGVEKTVSDLRAAANFERSLNYAKLVQNSLTKYLRPFGKGVKAGPFYVLYGVSMPALLIEFGFINSPQDQKWLQNQFQRNLVVQHLATELARTLKSD